MADPLSDIEIGYVAEICRVILQDTVSFNNGFGINLTLTALDKLKTQLTTICAGLDDFALTNVRDALELWADVRLAQFSIDGDVSCIHGIRINADDIRARCKEIVSIYIPVMTLGEGMEKRDKALSGGSYIRVG